MKKNLFKISIILLCFAFLLLITLCKPDALNTENEEAEEFPDIQMPSEEDSSISEEMNSIELIHNPELRILIMSNDFSSDMHDTVKVTSNKDIIMKGEDGTVFAEYPAWEMIDLDSFGLKTGESLIFESRGKLSVRSLNRAQGIPEYYGKLQIYREESGYAIINIVAMEDYLLTVVPSEMPSTYPLEALKAQAICARSYAYHYVINESGLPHDANMNDSTAFQVYNNIQETDNTNQAVKETEGMILTKDGVPVSTYFFSTSCGFTTNETVWKEYFQGNENEDGEEPTISYIPGSKSAEPDIMFAPVAVAQPQEVEAISTDSGLGILYTADALMQEQNFRAYIQSDTSNFLENDEQWYRWNYHGKVSDAEIENRLKDRYAAHPDLILTYDEKKEKYVNQAIKTVGDIINIEIVKRLPGGVADELLIETTADDYLIIGEYNIRYVLSDGVSEVTRNDGSKVVVSNLLPSAYFIIEPEMSDSEMWTEISLVGGGYGHGVGMSQNGAKQAALQGMSCEDILRLFYREFDLVVVK